MGKGPWVGQLTLSSWREPDVIACLARQRHISLDDGSAALARSARQSGLD
jgi:hypothetical protein